MKIGAIVCFRCGCNAEERPLFRQNEKGVEAVMACRPCSAAPVHPEVASIVTIIQCGPNNSCDHDMSVEVPLYATDGHACGSSKACSKCGSTAFDLSMWGA